MAVNRFQRYFRPGVRVFFRRAAIAGVSQPFVDLGVIKSAEPKIEEEKVQLMDSGSGRKKLFDQRTLSRTESYAVVTNNLNAYVMALLFSANKPVRSTKTGTAYTEQEHYCHNQELVGLMAGGKRAYDVASIQAITGPGSAQLAISAVNTGSKTFTWPHLSAGLSPGDKVYLRGNGGISNRVLTVVSAIEGGGSTVITVSETITGATASGNLSLYYSEGTHWEAVDLKRGLIRILSDLEQVDANGANLDIDFTTATHEEVTMLPGTDVDTINGYAELYLTDSGGEKFCREMQVSVTRGGMTAGVDDYSEASLTFDVIETVGAAQPAGRLVQFDGDIEEGYELLS